MGRGTGGAGGGSGKLPPFSSQGTAVFVVSNPLLELEKSTMLTV